MLYNILSIILLISIITNLSFTIAYDHAKHDLAKILKSIVLITQTIDSLLCLALITIHPDEKTLIGNIILLIALLADTFLIFKIKTKERKN